MNDLSRRGALALIGSLMATAARAQSAPTQSGGAAVSDSAVREILTDFIDVKRQSLGVAVGIVTPAGRRAVSHGVMSRADPRLVGADTVFGVASVTKTFTGLLLAEAVRRGEVTLADPVEKYLPKDVRVPERGGRKITLIDLATHTSGLPSDAASSLQGDPRNDAANPMAPVYATLRAFELATDIGGTWSYSNLGYSLLGDALARRAGVSYPELVRRRITAPLGLRDTAFTPTPAMAARRASGHVDGLQPAADNRRAWTLPAGGLMSTVTDLSTYVAAFAAVTQTGLAPAMAAMRASVRPAPAFNGDWGLGCLVQRINGSPVILHPGQGGGFGSCMAFDPATKTGVVVLSNAMPSVLDIGLHLLRPDYPLKPAQQAYAGPPDAVLDRLAGVYALDVDLPTQRLAKGARVTIGRRDGGINLSLPGLPTGPLTVKTPGVFTIAGFPVTVEFQTNADGSAASLTLTIANVPARASRVP